MESFFTSPLPPWGYDATALLIVALFGWRGSRRGAIKELFGLVAFVGAYPLAPPIGSLLAPLLPLQGFPPFLIQPIILSIGGIAAYILLKLVFFGAVKLLNLNREWNGLIHLLVRSGGAISGSLFGTLSILFTGLSIVVVGQFASVLELDTEHNSLSLLPARIAIAHASALQESEIGKLVNTLNPFNPTSDVFKETPLGSVTQGIKTVQSVMESPEKMVDMLNTPEVQEILTTPAVQELLSDPSLQHKASQGDIMGLLADPNVQALMNDPDVQKALQEVNVDALLKQLK